MTGKRQLIGRPGSHKVHPEPQMLGYGYDPQLSEGSVKPPILLPFQLAGRDAGKDGQRGPERPSARNVRYI